MLSVIRHLYGDSNWQLYDAATGKVNVTDSQIACEAAARPDVDPDYQNHGVECSLDYVGGGVSQTFLIPTTPVPADSTGDIGMQVGVTLNGVQLAEPAPNVPTLGTTPAINSRCTCNDSLEAKLNANVQKR